MLSLCSICDLQENHKEIFRNSIGQYCKLGYSIAMMTVFCLGLYLRPNSYLNITLKLGLVSVQVLALKVLFQLYNTFFCGWTANYPFKLDKQKGINENNYVPNHQGEGPQIPQRCNLFPYQKCGYQSQFFRALHKALYLCQSQFSKLNITGYQVI